MPCDISALYESGGCVTGGVSPLPIRACVRYAHSDFETLGFYVRGSQTIQNSISLSTAFPTASCSKRSTPADVFHVCGLYFGMMFPLIEYIKFRNPFQRLAGSRDSVPCRGSVSDAPRVQAAGDARLDGGRYAVAGRSP